MLKFGNSQKSPGHLKVHRLLIMLWVRHFVARTDRYNHELEAEDTEDETDDIMFHSFSSCSPRYSRVYSNFKELKGVSKGSVLKLIRIG